MAREEHSADTNKSEQAKAREDLTLHKHKEEHAKPEGEKVDSKRRDEVRNDKPGENLEEKENKEKIIWKDADGQDARGI